MVKKTIFLILLLVIFIMYLYNFGPLKGEIVARFDLELCSEEAPLYVTVTNNSLLDMKKYSFRIEAKRPGYSNVIRKEKYSYFSDRILPARSSRSSCWNTVTVRKKFYPAGIFPIGEIRKELQEDKSLDWYVESYNLIY